MKTVPKLDLQVIFNKDGTGIQKIKSNLSMTCSFADVIIHKLVTISDMYNSNLSEFVTIERFCWSKCIASITSAILRGWDDMFFQHFIYSQNLLYLGCFKHS